ncbi:MAG: WD40/YVTN/BNR-like repeat-containing protein [Pseudobacter sp.]|uniref:WD40/YVTN/BNR-like repeat-containing protein n=1 Tax=Pseudobacter sp. TaxID=2045420 RepID=UPI003F7E3B97
MTRKKQWISMLIVALIISGLASCSGKDKPVAEPDNPDNPGPGPGPGPVQYEAVPGWTKLQPGVEKIHTVFFVNDSTGYVCGQNIARTTDRGNTWTRFSLADTGFYELHFSDAAHGWALQNEKLYRTTDSGRNWITSPYPLEFAYAIQFPTASTGYMAGKGGLFKSVDGGANWNRIANFTNFVTHISFFEENKGWLLADGKKPYLTENGGGTYGAGVWSTDTLQFMNFPSKNFGFRLDKTGVLSSSTDAGGSWWAPTQTGIYAYHLEVPVNNAGYVLQAFGVQKFDATGITQMMKTPDYLADLHFPDMDHGWAVSPVSGGVLYRYVKP